MTKAQRLKETALERIMSAHREWEKRTLCDLRNAGYDFNTINQAASHLRARQTIRSMTEEQLVETFASMTKQNRN